MKKLPLQTIKKSLIKKQQPKSLPISQLTLYQALDAINIRDEGDVSFALLICQGLKTIETRRTRSLDCCVGKRVRIIRTGIKDKPSQIVGEVTIGEPFCYENEEAFKKDQHRHAVSPSSNYWIKEGEVKWGYPILRPTLYEKSYPTHSLGIVVRKNQPPPPHPHHLKLKLKKNAF